VTELTRRNLIRTSIVGAVLAPFATARDAFAAGSTKKGLYVRSRFAPLRQRRFTVSGGGHWSMRLVKVRNLPSAPRRDEHRFALTFRCTRGGPVQGSYTLHRHGFKPTTLFLVPSDARRRTYEAVVFNKPKR
jgi:hypothetical protein